MVAASDPAWTDRIERVDPAIPLAPRDRDIVRASQERSFADPTTGACAEGTVAIPQLRITLSYRVPRGASYALDTFPEQLRKAVTDHDDFVNVMPDSLMRRAVACINSGRRC